MIEVMNLRHIGERQLLFSQKTNVENCNRKLELGKDIMKTRYL